MIAFEYQSLVEKHTNQHANIARLTELESQNEFHKMLCSNAGSLLRTKMLSILSEVYLPFVLDNADDKAQEKINNLFGAIRDVLAGMPDYDTYSEELCDVYAVYSRVLADELIRIRRNKNVEHEAC